MENQISKSYFVKLLMCGIFAFFSINLIAGFLNGIFQLIFVFIKPSLIINILTQIFTGIARITALIIIFNQLIKTPELPTLKVVKKYLLIGVIIYGLLYFVNRGLHFLGISILSYKLDASTFGNLSLYKQYASYGIEFLNTITLIIFGIIALVFNKKNQTEHPTPISPSV